MQDKFVYSFFKSDHKENLTIQFGRRLFIPDVRYLFFRGHLQNESVAYYNKRSL